jgi:signal transduction histidine kinase
MLDSGDNPEPVSLGGTLRGQLDEIRASFPDAIVTTAGPVPSLKVYADEMLGSVFRNVISNAIVHNDRDVPAVTVAVTELPDRVRVSVADNGPGIPDDQKAEVFGRGKKGMESEGTGIGLYLVDTLVDQYDGEVWVEDRATADIDVPDLDGTTGAVFHIELQRA